MNRRVKEQIITGSLAGLLMERAGNSLNSSDADFLVGLPEVRSASPTENWIHESITELLARQVKRTRDSLACVDDEPALSYGELDRRSDNLCSAGLAARHVWLPAYYYTETGNTGRITQLTLTN